MLPNERVFSHHDNLERLRLQSQKLCSQSYDIESEMIDDLSPFANHSISELLNIFSDMHAEEECAQDSMVKTMY